MRIFLMLVWLTILGLATDSAWAGDDPFAGFAPPAEAADAPAVNYLPNPDFNAGVARWVMSTSYRHDPVGGRSGTGALRNGRADPQEYQLGFCDVNDLPRGVRYRFGAWVRAEKLNGSATVAFEYYSKKDGYLGGVYARGISGTGGDVDWTWVEDAATAPAEADRLTVVLYLTRGSTGTAWFDDALLTPDRPRWRPWTLLPLRGRFAPDGDGAFELGSFVVGKFPVANGFSDVADWRVRVDAARDGATLATWHGPVENHRLKGAFGALPEGPLELRLALADVKHKRILAETTLPAEAAFSRPPPANACVIDVRGRALVDGRPFLPVGLYTGNYDDAELDRIAESPFNCVMSYNVMNYRTKPAEKATPATIRDAMDGLHRRGLKLIFSIRDAEREGVQTFFGAKDAADADARVAELYRGHPALLAWYTADEPSIEKGDALRDRARRLAKLDPWHPTWSVHYQYPELPFFGGSGDLGGVDPYPVNAPGKHGMGQIAYAMDAAAKTWGHEGGLPVWGVVQLFNKGVYDSAMEKDLALYRKTYADPTEEEMRAMAFLMAIRGVRGFIFYSYFDLTKPPAWDQNRRWPHAVGAAKALRDLEGHLLSDREGPAVKVTAKKGVVEAAGYADADGRACVVVAAHGPGASEAELRVDSPKPLRSVYGRTERLPDGGYRFAGEDIDGDVLVEE